VYDSRLQTAGPLGIPRILLENRRLLGVLVRRDIVSRYKRSLLGLSWTLLNPLLEMSVLYVVFSHVFRYSTGSAPYVVYLLSGLMLLNLFRQTVIGVAGTMVNNTAMLSRIYVPLEVLSASSASVNVVNFGFGLIPLVAIMLLSGTAVSATVALILIPGCLLVAFASGVGFALVPLAVRFPDVLDLSQIALTMIGYLAAVFYPLSIVPHRFRWVIEANPLYHFISTFRSLLYGDSLGSMGSYAVMVGASAGALCIGGFVLTRYGRRSIAAL
jgi:ABC-type polysaccharide/polyol phosphate export permease